MTAGYSTTPLEKKLGLKDGVRALLIGAPGYLVEVTQYAGYLDCERMLSDGPRDRDFIHWFTTSRQEIETNIDLLTRRLVPGGMLWLSWPKKLSKVPTDITEDVLRAIILPTSLVDVKVCAIDDVWSGLKFMWRKEHRVNLI
jgi:hypothetical protein